MSRPPTGVVVTGVPRPSMEILDAFAQIGVATVHEAQGRTGLLAPRIQSVTPGHRIAGSAVTVSVPPGDNWMIHVAVEQCRPGDVLVVSPTSTCLMGYFGDLLATSLLARSVRGIVIDAGVRDVADLRTMPFPAWARCVSAQGTVKATIGSVNVPIVCAGQVVEPGDVVIGDDDGVVVVPAGEAEPVLAASRERLAKEEGSRGRYQSGELGLDVHRMRDELGTKGLTYVDHEEVPWRR